MKRFTVLIIIIIILAITGYFIWNSGLQPVNPNNKKTVTFTVINNEGVRTIISSLKKARLIKDPTVFFLLTKKLGIDKKLEAGNFNLSQSMNAITIANKLTHGTINIWVTIPEGDRAEQIADILRSKIPSFKPSWRQALDANEGYLFPDTYLIPKNTDINTVIKIMRDDFNQKFASIEHLRTTTLTNYQVTIVASIIAREAKFPQDKPLVASVIINRLNDGIPLEIDPTVQYALGYQTTTKTWWKQNLTLQDLQINSAYNTYKNLGLPPTPISNPNLSDLQAAINPAKSDYLYYYSDKAGKLHFATTLAQHQLNIQKYGH